MLRFLSKRKRSRKILLVVFIALLTLGLIVTFTPVLTGPAAGDDTVVAEVGDQDITVKELRNALSAKGQEIAQGQATARIDNPATIYALYGRQVLDDLIRQKLVLYEANRLGLEATDYEVGEFLKQMFNPWPGEDGYRQRVQQQFGMSTLEYEDQLRTAISANKLSSYVTAAVQVSPQEIEEDYKRRNTQYTVGWVDVTSDKFRDKVQVNDAELRAFFDQNKADFRITDEQRRARYVLIDPAKAGESIQVGEDKLREEYERTKENAVQQVRVSQIVLNVPPADPKAAKDQPADQKADPAEEVRKKAEDIVRRAQGADGKPGEDFAKLAQEFSADAASKAKGGDIGYVNKKDKRDTDDPLNRVFTMKQDEVSQPIRKGDKFYVLKVTDRKIPTFEESREQLRKEAQVREGYTKAIQIADEADDRFKATKDANAVAAEINSKHGAPIASVRETPFFAEGDTLPDLGPAPSLQSAIFDLENPNDVTDYVSISNQKGVAIAQLVEKKEPHDAAFDEVRAKVEASYRDEKAKELAEQAARKLAAEARTPEALKRAAVALGLKPDERPSLTGNDSIGPLVSDADRAPVYALNPGEVTREPIKVTGGGSSVVAYLVSRKDADMGQAFQNDKANAEERLLSAKRGTVIDAYLAAAQKRLTDSGDIEIFQERIQKTILTGEIKDTARPGAPLAPGPGAPPLAPSTRPRRTPQGVIPPGQ